VFFRLGEDKTQFFCYNILMTEKPPQLSKEQFNSNERSQKLRNISVGILRRAKELLLDDEIANDNDARMRLHSEIEHLGGQLLGLGITEAMHIGEPNPDFSNPVILAEQIAGQVIRLASGDLPSRQNTIPMIQEFSEEKKVIGDLRTDTLDPNNIPRQVMEFNDANIYLNVGSRLFDADEEVFGPDDE